MRALHSGGTCSQAYTQSYSVSVTIDASAGVFIDLYFTPPPSPVTLVLTRILSVRL